MKGCAWCKKNLITRCAFGQDETTLISLRSARVLLEDRGDDLPPASDDDAVILGANFHTITMLGDGTINDITISQRGSGRWFALYLAGGSPKITKCDCNVATSSVIGIGGGATPVITDCKIHGSEHGCGVVIFQGGKGELSRNEIFQNAMSGIEVVGEDSEPEVKDSRIHSNRGDGVLIYDSAKCTLTSNTIEKNLHAGTIERMRCARARASARCAFRAWPGSGPAGPVWCHVTRRSGPGAGRP